MITLKKLNLLGYTPETQVYVVQNGGGADSVNVSKFLQANKKHFQLMLFCGQHYYGLAAPRIAKFKEYALNKGFDVIEAGVL